MSRRVCLLVLALFGLALAGCGGQRLPDDVEDVLEKADEIELYSLNPSKSAKKETGGLRGWEVLGQTTLKGDDKKAIVKALKKGVAASDGSAAACFNPRHGIAAKHGEKTVELIICFECLSISGYENGGRFSKLTDRGPEATFNAMLKEKGVKLPPGREEK